MDTIELEYLKIASWKNFSLHEWEFLREAGICNGCGGRGVRWFERVVRYILQAILRKLSAVFVEASCEIHDATYWQGLLAIYPQASIEWLKGYCPEALRKLDERRRKECDYGFLVAIVNDIGKYVHNTWQVVGYTLLALLFYIMVRTFGGFYYQYS